SKVFIIPRKNVELANGFKRHETLKNFLLNTQNYLKEYFQRNNSESGWRVSQKREDRIDTSLFVRAVWHNLLLIYV
ncbi:MAG: ISNCY family transposase, partial [Nanoarchaeota archaeon]|nr:ISNCY family transposase [Nanoarchaeota archaeon]